VIYFLLAPSRRHPERWGLFYHLGLNVISFAGYQARSQLVPRRHDRIVHHHVPTLRASGCRIDAKGCLPVLLCLQRLRAKAEATAGRLLRILFVWLGAVPASPRVTKALWLGIEFGGRQRSRTMFRRHQASLDRRSPSPSAGQRHRRTSDRVQSAAPVAQSARTQ
jgi:hypothetical protein